MTVEIKEPRNVGWYRSGALLFFRSVGRGLSWALFVAWLKQFYQGRDHSRLRDQHSGNPFDDFNLGFNKGYLNFFSN
jgi:hypothetical protein